MTPHLATPHLAAVVAAAVALARDAFAVPARGGMMMGGGATANQVIAITDEAGRRRWVLRGSRRDPRRDRLEFLAAVHHAARARGVPVPAPVRTAGGQAWADDEHGVPWTLLEFLPGRPVEPVTSHLAEQAAARLAALHRLPDHLDTDAAAAAGVRVVAPDTAWDRWLTAPDQTWHEAAAVAGRHRGLLNAYRIHLDRLHHRTTDTAVLRTSTGQVWGHGDFHGHNLLHRNGRISGVLDLDGAGRRPRITDVAYALLMLARAGSGDYRLNPRLLRSIWTGYQSNAAAPLTPAEASGAWAAMLLSQLPDPAHLDALARTGRDLVPALTRPLAALRDLAAQRTRLTRLLLAEETTP